jgi:hypothetical protein
LDEVWV